MVKRPALYGQEDNTLQKIDVLSIVMKKKLLSEKIFFAKRPTDLP